MLFWLPDLKAPMIWSRPVFPPLSAGRMIHRMTYATNPGPTPVKRMSRVATSRMIPLSMPVYAAMPPATPPMMRLDEERVS